MWDTWSFIYPNSLSILLVRILVSLDVAVRLYSFSVNICWGRSSIRLWGLQLYISPPPTKLMNWNKFWSVSWGRASVLVVDNTTHVDPPLICQYCYYSCNFISRSSVLDGVGAVNYTIRQPIGVAGLISPWNLPLYLLTFKIAPAIACGNTVVIYA